MIRSDIRDLRPRLVGLFRNDPAAIVLVAANIAPVVDTLVTDEPVGSILIVYWLQMLIIGFWNCIKLIVIARWAALMYVPMFVVIYMAIVNIFGIIAGGLLDDQMRGTAWVQDFSLWNYWVPTLMFFAAHGLSFYFNFLGRREDETTSWEQQIGQPFFRAMPMWVAAIVGGFIGGFFNSAAFAVLFVLPVKIVLDLLGHFVEHGTLVKPPDPEPPMMSERRDPPVD